ncbi:MAG: glycosyltransferase family 2 protein [Candidatus Microsaccharimonas sp.]
MSLSKGITVLIPVLNEAENVDALMARLYSSLNTMNVPYEILFVDDKSTDNTAKLIKKYAKKDDRINLHVKKGEKGKANSIIEGSSLAQYNTVCMIDADLQYPPESIPAMYKQLVATSSDVVITNRKNNETSLLRKVFSAGFNLIFTKLLFGIDYDTQSGLKIFKTDIMKNISLEASRWSFDLEFIVKSLLAGYIISDFDIDFAKRNAGEAKLNVLSTSYELALASVKLRMSINKKSLSKQYSLSKLATKVEAV